jgi:ketosteroid isomerase-like protein
MKRRSLFALAGLAIGVAVPAFAQEKDALGNLAEAINKNDATAVAAIFTEDGVCVTPQGPIYGRAAIEEHYADVFAQFHLSNASPKADKNSPHSIGTDGKEAWETGEWSCDFQVSDDGTVQQNKGYYSAIYIREGDGWKIRMEIFNVTPTPEK